ncbi:MAG: glycosyltransferase family 2 protein, partial [Actinocrinis sp.]
MPSTEPRPRPTPSVAALVVTWNSAKVVVGLLDSLASGFEGVEWHVVIADNDSADETVGKIESWCAEHADARVRIVHTGGNLGYAAGINAARAKAERHDAALVLNPDIRLHPGSVRRMLDFIEADAGAGAGEGEGEADSAIGRKPPHPRTGIVVPRIEDED